MAACIILCNTVCSTPWIVQFSLLHLKYWLLMGSHEPTPYCLIRSCDLIQIQFTRWTKNCCDWKSLFFHYHERWKLQQQQQQQQQQLKLLSVVQPTVTGMLVVLTTDKRVEMFAPPCADFHAGVFKVYLSFSHDIWVFLLVREKSQP